jgi:hypothetical protein
MKITNEKITLCGSSRFKEEFEKVNRELTLQGNVVYSLAIFGHSDPIQQLTEEQKILLDAVHFKKIDNSESVFVINVNGYIGESTRNEIEYAQKTNKKIYYYEELKGE